MSEQSVSRSGVGTPGGRGPGLQGQAGEKAGPPADVKPGVPWVDPATDHHWLTRPATIVKGWWAFAVILTLTVLAQFLIPIKGTFTLESTFGFAAWYGFLACVAMVLVAKALGWWLKRPEGYYAEDDAGPCYTDGSAGRPASESDGVAGKEANRD